MQDILKKLVTTHAGYSILVLRVMLGIIFMAHGSQKLFGIFGGYGLEGTGKYIKETKITPSFRSGKKQLIA